ncbi:putative nucleic acid-binding Zn-ribbon protein [Natronospira proteinivora]|uniref:Nucleic acid-binding Zn-ribbon protein n=1 Tax=Natronospira proteinivora TaxID=1807133 RepID=A0ABT1G5D1_9GAMM|nr:hypothetical protein [Natronospira proteinivora]MCP1726512.1 putative nucleic acid-binding Zn-ribbon protein [Natronospira proteinivora]
MRDWLSSLPWVGSWFQRKVPEERRIQAPSNPQLTAERRRSEQLEEELGACRERESVLRKQLTVLEDSSQSDRQTLAALEDMLRDPNRAQNAIVYYQLREIWFACHRELVKLVEELAGNMEEEERYFHLERFRQAQADELGRLERTLSDVQEEYQLLNERRRKKQEELHRSQRIWHYFKRKRLEAVVSSLSDELKPIQQQINDTREHINEVRMREAPPYAGLSLEGRRRVNLAAIALAQYLYLRFRKDNLADMARGARIKPVHEAHFGPPEECLTIMRQIREVEGRWRSDKDRSGKVRRRARFLAKKAVYSREGQTVPDLRCLDDIQPSISQEGGEVVGDAAPLPVNVLDMDLWDLREAMR